MIISSNIPRGYTIIPNLLLNSPQIDPLAKIIWQLLRNKGRNWVVYNEILAKELQVTVTTLKKYLNQLISHGWLSRTARRNPKNGQLLGGYDYTLHSTPQLSTSSVDNLNSEINFFDHKSPDRQNLTPNKDIKKINNINNKPNVGLSSTVNVENVSKLDELELEAANQYVDQQKGVRDREAYLACTLRNGWHKQLYLTLKNKAIAKLDRDRLYKAQKRYKALSRTEEFDLTSEIYSRLCERKGQKNIDNLIQVFENESSSIEFSEIKLQLKRYFWFNFNFPGMLNNPEYLVDSHVIAYNVSKQLIFDNHKI